MTVTSVHSASRQMVLKTGNSSITSSSTTSADYTHKLASASTKPQHWDLTGREWKSEYKLFLGFSFALKASPTKTAFTEKHLSLLLWQMWKPYCIPLAKLNYKGKCVKMTNGKTAEMHMAEFLANQISIHSWAYISPFKIIHAFIYISFKQFYKCFLNLNHFYYYSVNAQGWVKETKKTILVSIITF